MVGFPLNLRSIVIGVGVVLAAVAVLVLSFIGAIVVGIILAVSSVVSALGRVRPVPEQRAGQSGGSEAVLDARRAADGSYRIGGGPESGPADR